MIKIRYKYTDKQTKQLLTSIVILVDTREQENSHIISYFEAKKIPWKSKALEFGDYSFYIPANEELDIPRDLFFTDEIVIERKAHLDELVGNLSERRQIEIENPYFDDLQPEDEENNPRYILKTVNEIQRIEAELVRAYKSNAIFNLVIENSPNHPSSWLDIVNGNYRSKYKPQSFLGRLYAFMARYKISISFIDQVLMGYHIHMRFKYYARERFNQVLMEDLERNDSVE